MIGLALALALQAALLPEPIQLSRQPECNDALRSPARLIPIRDALSLARQIDQTFVRYELDNERRERLGAEFATKFGGAGPLVIALPASPENFVFDDQTGHFRLSPSSFSMYDCVGLEHGQVSLRCGLQPLGLSTRPTDRVTGHYRGTTAFGAEATVTRIETGTVGVIEPIESRRPSDARQSLFEANVDTAGRFPDRAFVLALPRNEADQMLAGALWFVLYEPVYPFVADGVRTESATWDRPRDRRDVSAALVGRILCVSLGKAGEVPIAIRSVGPSF